MPARPGLVAAVTGVLLEEGAALIEALLAFPRQGYRVSLRERAGKGEHARRGLPCFPAFDTE